MESGLSSPSPALTGKAATAWPALLSAILPSRRDLPRSRRLSSLFGPAARAKYRPIVVERRRFIRRPPARNAKHGQRRERATRDCVRREQGSADGVVEPRIA